MPITHNGKVLDRDSLHAFADERGVPRRLIDIVATCLPCMLASREMIEEALLKTGWCDSYEEAECILERMWRFSGELKRRREDGIRSEGS